MPRHLATTPPDLHPLPPYPDWAPSHSATDLAPLLGCQVATLKRWRTQGYGPPAHPMGSGWGYSLPEVITWLASQRVIGTPLPPAGELADLGLTRAQLVALVEAATVLSLQAQDTHRASLGLGAQVETVARALKQVASDA